MKIQSNQFLSIEQLQDQYLQKSKPVQTSDVAKGFSFQEILRQKSGMVSEELKFSKHASNRLSDRNIHLTEKKKMQNVKISLQTVHIVFISQEIMK